MDFEFTDEQRGLRDATRRMLASSAPVTATRALVDSGISYDRSLWAKGAELGWAALAIPEEHGGFGQSLADLVIVAVEHGRQVVPGPFVPTVVVADAIVSATSEVARTEVLPGLLDGSKTAAWAFAEAGRPWNRSSVSATATRAGDKIVVRGAKVGVQDAATADHLLVDVALAGSLARVLIPADSLGVTIRRQAAFDITRELDDVTFDDVLIPESGVIASGEAAATGIDASLRMITILACGELVGVGERLLDMTVEYAKVREQFDRPIGSFQAIKHKCATMRIWLQGSTAATYYAAMAVAAHVPDADRAVSVAKSFTSDAIVKLAGEALQVHGGIGFTWEHDLHLYLRRAKSLELLYGDVAWHRELLCRDLVASGAS